MRMTAEHEYRELLEKAQASVEPIRRFLEAARNAPVPISEMRLTSLIEAAESHAKNLEHEIDEIWDLLERAS
jgi:hypothetical protein